MSELAKLAKLLKENNLEGTHSSHATRHYLDTGYPPLNKIVSGDHEKGFPSGQIAMIAGPSASGKTMVSTQLMISAQKQGGFAAFFDYERQYNHVLAHKQGLQCDKEGKDNSAFPFRYYQPLTYEEGITDAIKLAKLIRENNVIEKDAPIVFIFDSIHAMTPQSKRESIYDGKNSALAKGKKTSMHDNYALAAAQNAWASTINTEFNELGVTGIFLNQVRVKTDPQGNKSYTYPGGDALYFYCSTVLVLEGKKLWKDIKGKNVHIGHTITATTVKSRNTRPFKRVVYDFLYNDDGTGSFDVFGSYITYLKELGAFVTSGAWIKWNGMSFQGIEKLVTHYSSQADGLVQLRKLHKDYLEENVSEEIAELEEDVTEEG